MTFSEPAPFGLAGLIAAGGFPFQATNPKGIVGGFQLGYNWQSNNFVFGLVTDLDISGMRASTSMAQTLPGFFPDTTQYDRKVTWFGTTRAKLGIAQQNWLFSVNGGLAYGHVSEHINATACAPGNQCIADGSSSTNKLGWALGAGIDYGMGPWVLGVEYLYASLGRTSVTANFTPAVIATDSITVSSRNDIQLVRMLLSYRF